MEKKKDHLRIAYFVCCGILIIAYFMPCVQSTVSLFGMEFRASLADYTFGSGLIGDSAELLVGVFLLIPAVLILLDFLKLQKRKMIGYVLAAIGLLFMAVMAMYAMDTEGLSLGSGGWLTLLGYIAFFPISHLYLKNMVQAPQIGETQAAAAQAVTANGKEVKKCSKCGALLKTGAKFCEQCGEPVVVASSVSFCPGCGRECKAEEKFCEQCGTKLRD